MSTRLNDRRGPIGRTVSGIAAGVFLVLFVAQLFCALGKEYMQPFASSGLFIGFTMWIILVALLFTRKVSGVHNKNDPKAFWVIEVVCFVMLMFSGIGFYYPDFLSISQWVNVIIAALCLWISGILLLDCWGIAPLGDTPQDHDDDG